MHVEIKICYNVTIKISLCISIPSDPWETGEAWGGRCKDVEGPLLAGNWAVTKEAGAQTGPLATKSTSRLLQKKVPVTVSRPTDYSHWKIVKLPIIVTFDFHTPEV